MNNDKAPKTRGFFYYGCEVGGNINESPPEEGAEAELADATDEVAKPRDLRAAEGINDTGVGIRLSEAGDGVTPPKAVEGLAKL